MFTIENIKKICKENKINVLIYIQEQKQHVDLFVNSEKEAEKLEVLDEIMPCNICCDIKVAKSMVIEGFTILQTEKIPFFNEMHEYFRSCRIIEHRLLKNRIKRFWNNLSKWRCK